jgi:hypothetical protein
MASRELCGIMLQDISVDDCLMLMWNAFWCNNVSQTFKMPYGLVFGLTSGLDAPALLEATLSQLHLFSSHRASHYQVLRDRHILITRSSGHTDKDCYRNRHLRLT